MVGNEGGVGDLIMSALKVTEILNISLDLKIY